MQDAITKRVQGVAAISMALVAGQYNFYQSSYAHARAGLQEAARNDHTEVVKLLGEKGGCIFEDDKVQHVMMQLRL